VIGSSVSVETKTLSLNAPDPVLYPVKMGGADEERMKDEHQQDNARDGWRS
jgi:hypothetical protein